MNETYATHQELQNAIRAAYKAQGAWRKVGRQFGITPAMAWRIVNQGYDPKTPEIRHRLGLPALIPTPPCGKCGAVHVSKRCTAKPREYRDLFAMPPEELLRRLNERSEV